MQDVTFDGTRGSRGVASGKVSGDLAVFLKGLAHALRPLPQHVAWELFPHLFDQPEKHRVAGPFVQGFT